MSNLERTGLFDLHVALGAKMVPFAGYEMPVQYPMGVLKEHLHCRAQAGLFDVSHMGQVILRGAGVAEAFEALMPVDVLGVTQGRQRYGMFTNDAGGILDDLMFANRGDHLFVVVNAACKAQDIAHLRAHLPAGSVEVITDRALLALQGPMAEAALARLLPDVAQMRFMDVATHDYQGHDLWVSRSGYTGEDGFEISVHDDDAERIARLLVDQPEVEPIGLGARDSLRLEAGLCLYGHDMDTSRTPVEADLQWVIQKSRRVRADFPGAAKIIDQLTNGAAEKRVGIRPLERAPAREGTEIHVDGQKVGEVTSGGFGPSVDAPVAMGYVRADLAEPGTKIDLMVRGKARAGEVAALPFVKHNYKR